MFDDKRYLVESQLQRESLLKSAFERGFLRLGSGVTFVILLLILLKTNNLTEPEFFLPMVLGPLLGFLYCASLGWIKHNKTEDPNK